jgi:hypothetical protein
VERTDERVVEKAGEVRWLDIGNGQWPTAKTPLTVSRDNTACLSSRVGCSLAGTWRTRLPPRYLTADLDFDRDFHGQELTLLPLKTVRVSAPRRDAGFARAKRSSVEEELMSRLKLRAPGGTVTHPYRGSKDDTGWTALGCFAMLDSQGAGLVCRRQWSGWTSWTGPGIASSTGSS